ncbi:MFS transporter [Sphingopyxis sp. CCNWLW253]|uniref:MFS transporter n=1 Tax=unclassified Sphingopyxis TaxID=2614943 RepID=UPI0030131630
MSGPDAIRPDDWPENYGPASAWWAVAVFMIFQIVSMIDRQVMSVLIPEMRADLGLNDFQISLVQGLAFALFYGVMGLVIGGLVDRYSRRKIMFAGIVVWSIAAAGTGLARNYMQLFAGRLLVGAGEAAISPAAQSMLSGIFPRNRLTTPIACVTVAGALGISISYALGGYLLELFTAQPLGGLFAELAPWRQVLVVTGLPGVLIAFLAFTVRTPVRKRDAPDTRQGASWGHFFAFVRVHKKPVIGLVVGSGLMALAIQGSMIWTPTYARRVLGMGAGDVGGGMSIAVAFGSVVGGLAFGLLMDRLYSRGIRDASLRLAATFGLIIPPIVAAAIAYGDPTYLFASFALMMFTMGATFGPIMAAIQMLAPPEMRGRFAALAVLSSNFFGYAAGPMLIGFLTDYVFADPMKIGLSMICCLLLAGPAATMLFWSARRGFLERLGDAA